jgi:hypothetical protein
LNDGVINDLKVSRTGLSDVDDIYQVDMWFVVSALKRPLHEQIAQPQWTL